MSDRANLVRVLTSSTGTATMTLGAAYSQLFMTSAEAGMIDGRTYSYLIVDGNNWELGKGVYTASGTTLSRVTVEASRIAGTLGTSKITLSGTAQVRIIEAADDMGALRGTRAVTGTSDALVETDLGRAVTYSNAAAIAVSLAQAFQDGWTTWVKNTGAGAVTITPATSTINGGATLVLPTGHGAMIWSDGTNYHAGFMPVTKPLLAANNLADVANAATARTNVLAVGVVRFQKFAASGTYTPHANLLYCHMRAVGGGAGGGGSTGGVGQIFGGGGGGSGGPSETFASAATIGASKTVTIGAAGTGGAAGSNNGAAGGDTSVGTLCIAKGGSGGLYGANTQVGGGGPGGVAGTGDVAGAGNAGGPGNYHNTAFLPALPAGFGGSSIFGGGAPAPGFTAGAATAGAAATGFGSGGSGAISSNIAANAAGGAGSAGFVIIIEFCSQ